MRNIIGITSFPFPAIRKDRIGKTKLTIFQRSCESGPGLQGTLIVPPGCGQMDVDGNKVDHKAGKRAKKPQGDLQANDPGLTLRPVRQIIIGPQILMENIG